MPAHRYPGPLILGVAEAFGQWISCANSDETQGEVDFSTFVTHLQKKVNNIIYLMYYIKVYMYVCIYIIIK
jgi:hypothetical protein